MSYSKELSSLVIDNIKFVDESSKVSEEISNRIFSEINLLCEKIFKNKGYKGVYSYIDKELYFAPETWKCDEDEEPIDYVEFDYVGDPNSSDLGTLIGQYHGDSHIFRLSINHKNRKITKPVLKKRIADFWSRNSNALSGFTIGRDGYVMCEIRIDQKVLSDNYPDDFESILSVVKDAVEKIHENISVFERMIEYVDDPCDTKLVIAA